MCELVTIPIDIDKALLSDPHNDMVNIEKLEPPYVCYVEYI